MEDEPYFYHPLENIEDIEIFEEAVNRKKLTRALSKERPYTYWTMELYDQENGIRGGGGLGILASDTRRIAEQMEVPFTLITPFYPIELKQVMENNEIKDVAWPVDYHDYGFKYIDSVYVRCCGNLCKLDVINKKFASTEIICITEPNFRELYADLNNSDHRLYQEVSLGFGGYQALKLLGLKPAIMQLNEAVTFFGALARLDELVKNGMDFYEAVVYTRKHTLYTNHTLVQVAETKFSYSQFERFVFPNLNSPVVKKWLSDKFEDGELKLSTVTIEIAEMRSSVSKLHARVANYHDIAGEKVKFKPITNGIDMKRWVMPDVLKTYQDYDILDDTYLPTLNFQQNLDVFSSEKIRELKAVGRDIMNKILMDYKDQDERTLQFETNDMVFVFKKRFVDYKRPDLPFEDLTRLKEVLQSRDAHYILTGRLHTDDEIMMKKLKKILSDIKNDEFLSSHVHYLPDYDERLAYGLSVGCNVAINVPVVGTEACGTSWMKDVANLGLLISTHDGGVADVSRDYCLNVDKTEFSSELDAIYARMAEAIAINDNDFDLEFMIKKQLSGYLPIISGTRMFEEYLAFLFR